MGHEQKAVDVREAGQLRQPGRLALARSVAQPVGELGQGGRTQEAAARVDHLQRRQRRVALHDRQPRAGGVAVERQGRRREELTDVEALIGQRVRDLMDERQPLAFEGKEIRDQQPLRGRVVDRAGRG